jgi:hypothetical protein
MHYQNSKTDIPGLEATAQLTTAERFGAMYPILLSTKAPFSLLHQRVRAPSHASMGFFPNCLQKEASHLLMMLSFRQPLKSQQVLPDQC